MPEKFVFSGILPFQGLFFIIFSLFLAFTATLLRIGTAHTFSAQQDLSCRFFCFFPSLGIGHF